MRLQRPWELWPLPRPGGSPRRIDPAVTKNRFPAVPIALNVPRWRIGRDPRPTIGEESRDDT